MLSKFEPNINPGMVFLIPMGREGQGAGGELKEHQSYLGKFNLRF